MAGQSLSLQTRIRHWTSSIPAVIWILFAGGLINSIGTAFLWPLNSLYIHTVLGKSMTTAGLVLMSMNGAGVLGSLVGGYLYDRIGGKPVMLMGLLGSAVVVLSLGFITAWPLYVAGMVLLGFTQSMVWPSANALIGELWPTGGRRAFNMFYVVNNLGVAIGTAIGGMLAAISFLLVFVFNAISYLIYTGVFVIAMRKHRQQLANEPVVTEVPAVDSIRTAQNGMSVPITLPVLFLSLGMLVSWTAYSQWVGPIAVYTDQQGYGLTAYSFLWTLNGLIIVAGQPILTNLLKRFMSAISVQVLAGSMLYFLTFLLIAWHPNYTGLLLGMVIMTIGEMIILPGVPAAVSQLAAKERMGFYQGIVASASTGGRMAGPVLGGLIFDNYGSVSLFGFAAAICVVAMASFVGFYFTTRRYILK